MNLFSTETQNTINTKGVTAKTYDAKVKAVGFGNFVKSLGGIFTECYGHMSGQATTESEFYKRTEYVCGLMAVFKFCYWNGTTWWYWLNSASKAFYTSKITNKGCSGGTIYQLCQGTGGRLRITCCNYGVDTLLKALGTYSLKKTNVTSKSKLVPGDVVDLFRKSDGKWHHQVVVYAIEGNKIWCVDFGNRFIKTGKPLHYMSLTGTTAGGEYGTDKWIGRHRYTFKKTAPETTKTQASVFSNMPNEEVMAKVGPLFTADMKKSGVLASVSMAQFILESGYGKSELAKNANNCFGMKKNLSGNTWAGSTWDGKSVYTKKTGEDAGNGNYYTVTADFRKYSCVEDSIADHSAYLVGAKNGSALRYAGLKGCTDYKKAAQIIKNGGYATSSTYVSKLCNLIETLGLTKYDVAKKEEDIPVPRTVKKGNTGKAVKVVQSILGGLTIDGKFGAKTDAAVRNFQKAKGLTVDGIVGPKTWRALLVSIQ